MKSLYLAAIIIVLSIPTTAVFAQPDDGSRGGQEQNRSGGLQYSIESPLSPNIGSFESLLREILNVLLIIAVPIIVFFIIFAGFTYVTAQGNPEKIKLASQALMYGIIGGVVILGSSAMMVIIRNLVNAF